MVDWKGTMVLVVFSLTQFNGQAVGDDPPENSRIGALGLGGD